MSDMAPAPRSPDRAGQMARMAAALAPLPPWVAWSIGHDKFEPSSFVIYLNGQRIPTLDLDAAEAAERMAASWAVKGFCAPGDWESGQTARVGIHLDRHEALLSAAGKLLAVLPQNSFWQMGFRGPAAPRAGLYWARVLICEGADRAGSGEAQSLIPFMAIQSAEHLAYRQLSASRAGGWRDGKGK